jgi:hypothetical protein
MRKTLLFLFVQVACYAYSQSWQFVRHYGDTFSDDGLSVGRDNVGNLYVCGTRSHLSNGNCTDCYYQGVFYKLDAQGNLIWKKTNYYSDAKLVTDPSGNTYMVWGGRLIKFDANGNQLWFLADSSISFRTIAIYPAGGVAISGATFNEKGVVARIDENGNKIWEDKRSFYHYLSGNVSVDQDGNIYYSGGYKPDTNIVNKGVMVKLSATGTLLSSFSIPTGIYTKAYRNGIYLLKGGGPWESEAGMEPDDFTWHLVKYDMHGNITWHNRFTCRKYGPNINDMTLDANGNLIMTGDFVYTLNMNGAEVFNAGYHDFYILKLDTLGNILWKRSESNNKGMSIGISQLLSVGNEIYATGSMSCQNPSVAATYGNQTVNGNEFTGFPYSDLLIAKIFDESFVGIQEQNSVDLYRNFIVYPNPSRGNLIVSLPQEKNIKIKVINTLGAVVYEFSAENSTVSIDISHLKPGAYFITCDTNTGLRCRKVIIQ